MLDEAADIDRRSFSPPWANDASALGDIMTATPYHRSRSVHVDGRMVAFSISGRADRSGYVQRLAVDPSARRHGFARLLLDDALRWMTRRGVSQAMVNTATDNRSALALYESARVRPTTRRVADPRAGSAVSTRYRPRRRRIAVGGVALLLSIWPATSSAGAHAERPAQSDSVVRLELIDQRFATDPNGEIQLRYLLTGLDGDPLQLIPPAPPAPAPPVVDPADPGAPVEPALEPVVVELPALTIEVTNYLPLSDPDDVASLVGSDVDPAAFRRVGDAVDGVAFDARPLLTRNDDGTVELILDIGTDVVDSIETRLKMERPGIYPLRVQLLIGDRDDRNVVATAGTVIQRLAGAGDADVEVAPPIDLSVVTVTPAPRPGADEATIELARTNLDQSVDLAAELDPPVTLEVPPTLIAEAAATPTGSERLAESLADDELVALPLIPLDVSSAAAADRADAYTRLVAAGEDVLTEAVPTTPSRRDVWITTDELERGRGPTPPRPRNSLRDHPGRGVRRHDQRRPSPDRPIRRGRTARRWHPPVPRGRSAGRTTDRSGHRQHPRQIHRDRMGGRDARRDVGGAGRRGRRRRVDRPDERSLHHDEAVSSPRPIC